MLVVSYR